MKDRLSAVAEETLLTLAPLDLEGLLDDKEEEDEAPEEMRRLVVVASSDGPVADLEFIGGAGNETNIEDRIRQLQQHDSETPVENEMSLRLLRGYASICAASTVPRDRHHHGSSNPSKRPVRGRFA